MSAAPVSKVKVVGYCRVSTETQSEEGVSLAAQEAKIRAYCDLYSLDLVSLHVDAGVSGKSLHRPGIRAALAELDAGVATGLVVCKLDRLTRSVSDLGTLIDGYFGKRCSLLSVADSIDTRTAAGRMVLGMLAVVAAWEADAVSERTSDALRALKAQGVHIGGVSLGYAVTDEVDAGGRRVIKPVEEEQATVGRIMELRSQGLSLRNIAATMTSEGHRTKKGGRWQSETIRAVVKRVQASQGQSQRAA